MYLILRHFIWAFVNNFRLSLLFYEPVKNLIDVLCIVRARILYRKNIFNLYNFEERVYIAYYLSYTLNKKRILNFHNVGKSLVNY